MSIYSEPNMFVGVLNSPFLFKYNKLPTGCQIPSWMCCNLDGNREDTLNNDVSDLVEDGVFDADIHRIDVSCSCNGKQ